MGWVENQGKLEISQEAEEKCGRNKAEALRKGRRRQTLDDPDALGWVCCRKRPRCQL